MSSTTRRSFLRLASAAVLTAGCTPLSRSARPGGLSLGFSLYGMKSLSLEDAITTCARIGYRNVCLLYTSDAADE